MYIYIYLGYFYSVGKWSSQSQRNILVRECCLKCIQTNGKTVLLGNLVPSRINLQIRKVCCSYSLERDLVSITMLSDKQCDKHIQGKCCHADIPTQLSLSYIHQANVLFFWGFFLNACLNKTNRGSSCVCV